VLGAVFCCTPLRDMLFTLFCGTVFDSCETQQFVVTCSRTASHSILLNSVRDLSATHSAVFCSRPVDYSSLCYYGLVIYIKVSGK
jgi:hypothetical protein